MNKTLCLELRKTWPLLIAPEIFYLKHLEKEKQLFKTQRSIVSTGDIFSDTLSGTDTAAELGDFPESEDEKTRKKKVELTFKLLRETGKYSGLSQVCFYYLILSVHCRMFVFM